MVNFHTYKITFMLIDYQGNGKENLNSRETLVKNSKGFWGNGIQKDMKKLKRNLKECLESVAKF